MSDSALNPGLIDAYTVTPAVYDEVRDKQGNTLEHWGRTLELFDELGSDVLNLRADLGIRAIARNGIAYNPHDDANSGARPSQLNIIPFNMGQDEWPMVSKGIQQWAHLGELVLQDLLGPQEILKNKIVPPDFLYGHPNYQPAYHTVHESGETRLHLCASDLARSPNGCWWTTGFRTRAPFGLGYVIENRLMMTQLFPELYKDNHLHRIAPFFVALREKLSSLAPRSPRNPRVVLWSPGPDSDSYFEDAYLARYLNYTLVLSGDLTVREGRVFLKTLRGLLPVDVLMRRNEDELCDSTELDPTSRSGIAGLAETLRRENVAVVNGLGCNLLEAPLLFAYGNPLAKFFLDEELRLPPVATWWCGDEKSLHYVLENLDLLMIRSAFAKAEDAPIIPSKLSGNEHSILVEKIKQNPAGYVGQESVQKSNAPSWNASGLQAGALDFRGYCLAAEDQFVTLNGGLARVSSSANAGVQLHDVRIHSDEPVDVVTLLGPKKSDITLQRGVSYLPSRVCDNFFWLGRTLERMEALIRIQRVACRISFGDYDAEFVQDFLSRCFAAEPATLSPPILAEDSVLPKSSDMLQRPEIFERKYSGGLQSMVNQAISLASTVRDRIAVEMWRSIRSIEDKNAALLDSRNLGDTVLIDRLDDFLGALSSVSGLAHESMSRTDAWNFLDLGRRIERALQIGKLIRTNVLASDDDDTATLELLLEIVDSIMTYRGRYLAAVEVAPVMDLLICDESNPRSIAFQLASIQEHVNLIHHGNEGGVLGEDQKLALSMYNSVRLIDAQKLSRRDKKNGYARLLKYIKKLETQLAKLSDAIAAQYLVHAGSPQHYAATSSDDNEL